MVQNKLLLRNQYQQQQHINMSRRGIAPVQHSQQQMNVSTVPSSNIQPRQAVITRPQTIPGHNRGQPLISMGASKNNCIITNTTATTSAIAAINNGTNNNISSSKKNINVNDSGNNSNNNNNNNNNASNVNNSSSKNLRNDGNNDNLIATTISSTTPLIQPIRSNVNNSLNLQQGQIMLQKYRHKPPQNISVAAISQPQQQHLQQLKPRVQQPYQTSNQLPEHHMHGLGIRPMQRSLQQQQQQSPSHQQMQLRYQQHQQ